MRSALVLFLTLLSGLAAERLTLKKGSRIALVGGGLGSRMMQFGAFETKLHEWVPDKELVIRNLCDEGDTPGFRPHSARPSPWAFPGAEKFHPPLSDAKDRWGSGHTGVGSMPSPDEWLTRMKADIIIGFFGYPSSFKGEAGVENFKAELRAWIQHTKSQKYNRVKEPQIALIGPTSFENPKTGRERLVDANCALYSNAMKAVAQEMKVPFVDCYSASKRWLHQAQNPLTRDGILLNGRAFPTAASQIIWELCGLPDLDHLPSAAKERRINDRETTLTFRDDLIKAAVLEKNRVWEKYYKIPNGVHVYGRRHRPFGPVNYPAELEKLAQMTANRDRAIWAAAQWKSFDLAAADTKTRPLPEVESNYRPSKKNGTAEYLCGDEALASFTMAPGYQIDLFASEKEFPELANPVQITFDNQGRLWVATMPTYPHWKPGDPKPDDKLLILEDTNDDGKADKQTIFAGGLHLPTGFEISHDGVYVAQGNHLIFLKDSDGDDQADVREIVLSGFDDHDTHHVISAFCADPTGAIYMGEGTFLHSNVETAYGVVRSSNGGFFRFTPQRNHLERIARLSIPNPWGTAFDEWGQPFFLETSDPDLHWMTPGTVKVDYGQFCPKPPAILERNQRVRPTSGLEFVSSRHFPEEVQGDVLLNNTIGFLGTKQHQILDSESGYQAKHRHDLVKSSDGNFRPVDLEFAPDGSLYLCDWHNVLVGHMQHSARDPLRDHVHGRIYRITYPERPLVEPAKIHEAPLATLFDNLTLPEDRTRSRTRRELRARPAEEVLPALQEWLDALDPFHLRHSHHRLEALWVTAGLNRVDRKNLEILLNAPEWKVQAATIEVLRTHRHQIDDAASLLLGTAASPYPRVRLQAAVAASWFEPKEGLPVLEIIAQQPVDEWLKPALATAQAHLKGQDLAEAESETIVKPTSPLEGEALTLFKKGAEVYSREGHCITCHQADGQGLPAAMFPPLAGTKWVQGSEERLIKLTLHGLMGPIEVKGQKYPGQVPMTAFKQLSDEELAAVLTYVRNSFGNRASAIQAAKVEKVRKATENRTGFYVPAELLEDHPHRE